MRILITLWVVVAISSITVDNTADAQAPANSNRGNRGAAGRNGAIPARTQIRRSENRQQDTRASRPPQGWQITPAQQQWVDQILKYWEARSDKVERFACKFERWEYNPAFVRDPNTPWTQAAGEIKYEAPDKAIYRVTDLQHYQAPQNQGERPSYVRRDDVPGEYWVCDGKSTFEFDHRNKQVIERPLPEHMQGEAIADGPLPFLFGAEAAKLKQRYWFKPLTPPKVKNPQTGKEEFVQGEYWLAAKPKTLQDAQNFELVELIIDQKQFLPKAMQIYMPGGNERKVFQFAEREVNPRQRFWEGNFIKPNVPRGWKLVRENPADRARSARNAIGQRRAQGQHSGQQSSANRSQIPVAQRR